ncbi:MAG: FtsW/RodA/SpoVE family cell cycle protein [Lachnospiraceae bacterium]|nr:FtsW/RodA/SpoVE family cell cycle protein [Lachnospiraceae bacterium]MCI1726743.1 FtsW/RodA/SpoVE family cell cycle protein [Lachnospiraceae bacterium]
MIQLSKFMFILLILLYCLEAYTYFRKKTPEKKKALLKRQVVVIYTMVILGYVIIFINTMNYLVLLLCGGIIVYYAVTLMCYRLIYPKASMLLVNDMLMLLSIGFIIIARLDMDEAVKQFMIAAGGTVVAFLIPVIVRKLKILPKLTWLYAALGIASLLVVLGLATISGGAKLSLTVGGITIQFSELVKITLVFFMAAMLSKDSHFKSVAVTTIVAGIHVIILVLSTDLGTALVFFVTYLVMVYVATRKPAYTAVGLGAGVLAGIAAYFLFAHVRKRVVAWQDPFKVYDSSGYQIVQALFAIGAGGWFGAGLCQGSPDTIPVASKDFVFAAICEEFGSVFAISLILVCMSMFLLIVNISFEIRDKFYKLVALGLGTEYAFQVFLTIGGVTKFIPMTGITLPLVSYGGSSVMSTIIMLAIVQGLYILREDEGAAELEEA